MRRSTISKIFLIMIAYLVLLAVPAYGQGDQQNCFAGQGPLAPGQERCLIFDPASGIGFPATAITPRLLGDYLIALNKFFFRLAIVLAVLMISIGGFQWLIAIGNASKIANAKETIEQAVIGLVLAMTAYLLFLQIDKSFVPPFKPLELYDTSALKLSCSNLFPKAVCEQTILASGIQCHWTCDTTSTVTTFCCVAGPPDLGKKAVTLQQINKQVGAEVYIQAGQGNQVNSDMRDGLVRLGKTAIDRRIRFRVTEAFPVSPTVQHQDRLHSIGCAIDFTVEVLSGSAYVPLDISELAHCRGLIAVLNDLQQAGLVPVNEYAQGKAYDNKCLGTESTGWTANHIHASRPLCSLQ